jgi:hypothetical protein
VGRIAEDLESGVPQLACDLMTNICRHPRKPVGAAEVSVPEVVLSRAKLLDKPVAIGIHHR